MTTSALDFSPSSQLAQVQTEPRHTIHGSVPQEDPLKVYFLERRRALLAEVAAIERLLGFEKKTVDKR